MLQDLWNAHLASVVDNFRMTPVLPSPNTDVAVSIRPLIVRFAAFGDVVLLTPLIAALARRYGAPVDLLSSGAWTPELLAHDPNVREIKLITSRKTPYWLCPSQWQAVRWLAEHRNAPVYLCDPEPQALALLVRAGIPRGNIVRAWDDWAGPQTHWVDWWLQVAARTPLAFAASAVQADVPSGADAAIPQLYVSEADRAQCADWLLAKGLHGSPLVLLQPGNKRTLRRGEARISDNKYWAPERWAAVIGAVLQDVPDARILLCGALPEQPPLEEIRVASGDQRVINLAGELPISRLLPLLQTAHSMISIDTGPAHAAAALGCPLVVLFGAMGSTRWRPRSKQSPVVALESNGGESSKVMDISANQVIAAWRTLPLPRH